MLLRKIFLLIVLLAGIPGSRNATGAVIDPDSLENVLESSVKYEIRFKTLHELSKYHLYTDPVKSESYLIEGLKEARINGDSSAVAKTYMRLSQLGSIQGEYDKALKYDRYYLRLSETELDTFNITQALNNIGDDYQYMGFYNDAYDNYQKARKLAIALKDDLLIAVTSYNIGTVLKQMGQLEQAEGYIRSSMELSRQINDREGIAYSLKDLGEIYRIEGKFSNSLEALKESLVISDSLGLNYLTPEIYHKLAETYCAVDSLDQALNYYNGALEIYRRVSNNKGIGDSYLGIGRLMIDQNEDLKAESHLESALAIALKEEYGKLARDSYEQLSRLYEKRGNYQESLRLHKKLKVLDDSLFSEKKNEQFAKLQLLHETEQKDSEIRLIKEQVSNEEFKSNVLVVILALAAVILFNLYRSSVRRKKINRLLIVHQKEIEANSKEMEALLEMKDKFFSIISHDLRSPINGLVGVIDMLHEGHITQDELKEVSRSLKGRLNNTRKLLDNLLDWALFQMDHFKVIEEPLDMHRLTEDNLNFFREINDKHVHFFNKVPEHTMAEADRNMTDLVIRNLVSNSMKFTDEGGMVEVLAEELDDQFLMIAIRDNGIGMTDEEAAHLFDNSSLYSTRGTANERGTGLGLKLCQEFVERMGGKIWVESEKGTGSTFKFTVKKAESQ